MRRLSLFARTQLLVVSLALASGTAMAAPHAEPIPSAPPVASAQAPVVRARLPVVPQRPILAGATPAVAARLAIAASRPVLPPVQTAPLIGAPRTSTVFSAVARAALSSPSPVSRPNIVQMGNRIVKWPLVGADELAEGARELIISAKKEVFIETMILDESTASAGVMRDAIRELARTRPDVPVYIRFTGASFRPKKEVERLEKFFASPNVHITSWESRSIGNWFSPGRWIGRNVSHSKTVVADNERALVSDANYEIGSDELGSNPRGHAWFQTGMIVEGPIAASIREQSAEGWQTSTHPITLPPPPKPAAARKDGVPMIALGQHVDGGPETSANQAYVSAFANAQKRVCIMTPNLNDPETMQALAEATKRADVYIILPKGFNQKRESLPGVGGGNAKNVDRLAALAADPANLHIHWNADPEGEASKGNGVFASHAKTILVDDVVFVGSKNLDIQSARISREFSIAVQDAAAADRFHDLFMSRWQSSPVAFEHH